MQSNSHYNEQELLIRLAAGDEMAFTMLYQQYYGKLYKYIFPFVQAVHDDTVEIVQTIFLRVWIKRELLVGLKAFEFYLYRMARNYLLDMHRRNLARQQHETQYSSRLPVTHTSINDEVDYKEYLKVAIDAINLLPERKRTIYNLSVQEDFTLDQISHRLGLSKAVVKKDLYTAIRFIKEYLQSHGDAMLIWWLMTSGTAFLHYYK